MTIKKAYQELVDFLQENESKKVATILPQVIEMCSAKTGGGGRAGTTFIKDAEGQTVAIFDYYFKRWMPLVGPEAVEFGAKANSATGYNNMSKLGTSLWTKQQRQKKAALESMIKELEEGTLAPEDIAARRAQIEEEAKQIAPPVVTDEDGNERTLGFDSKEELVAYLEENGVMLAEGTND